MTSRTIWVPGKKVEKSEIRCRAHTMTGAGSTHLLYLVVLRAVLLLVVIQMVLSQGVFEAVRHWWVLLGGSMPAAGGACTWAKCHVLVRIHVSPSQSVLDGGQNGVRSLLRQGSGSLSPS